MVRNASATEFIHNATNIRELGELLVHWGYQVGEHPCFGGVHPVHVAGSYHYIACALDINADRGEQHTKFGTFRDERNALDALYTHLLQHSQETPVELLYRFRLWHGTGARLAGFYFHNAAITANHMNHLHVAYRAPYGGRHGCDGKIQLP